MSRTANRERPKQLRSAILGYLIKHGLNELSLRPLAKAVGSSPRVLLYYFGSKENMVIEVLAEARRQQRTAYDKVEGDSFAEACGIVWKRMSAPDSDDLRVSLDRRFRHRDAHGELHKIRVETT